MQAIDLSRYTIIASNEGIAVTSSQLAIDIFFRLFQSNVHVPVDRLELAWKAHVSIRLSAQEVKDRDLPLYTTPEFNLTVTGAPIISERNPDGSLPSVLDPFSIFTVRLEG